MSKIRISQMVGEPLLENFDNTHTVHQIEKGGRFSTKSTKNSIKIPFHFATDPYCEAVVIRKTYKDHRDSTFPLLKQGFERLGWKLEGKKNYPEGKNATLWLETNQGNYIHFVGLNNSESVKGAVPTRKDNAIKIVLMFEITEFKDEKEMQDAIQTYVRGGNKDYFIILYEFNPAPKLSHWTYDWLAKMEQRDDTYIQHTNYNDLPQWQQEEWLGKFALQEAETMKKVDYEQYKHIFLGLPANLAGGVYKLFNDKSIQEATHNYIDVSIGVDFGSNDATVFTVCGYKPNYEGIEIPETWYHKNGEDGDIMSINHYLRALLKFATKIYKKYNMPISVYIDPANLSFKQLVEEESFKTEYSWLMVERLSKRKRSKTVKSAVQERIDFAEIMFGANYLTIDPSNRKLIKAFHEAEYNKHGDRADDGTSDIDSLDSFEYSWLDNMTFLKDIILK